MPPEKPEPASDVRCTTCRNWLLLCRHDLPWQERAKSLSVHTLWAKSSHR
jgi:hypothetical protein